MEKKIESFWSEFLEKKNLDKHTKYVEAFHFELNEKLANELLQLVLNGQKKATASSLLGYEIEQTILPKIGDYSMITDWEGNPKCVIETINVAVIPYKDITFDICKREGEDDTLESWRQGHERFFREEGKALGYEFSEDMPVVFEDFKVVYQV